MVDRLVLTVKPDLARRAVALVELSVGDPLATCVARTIDAEAINGVARERRLSAGLANEGLWEALPLVAVVVVLAHVRVPLAGVERKCRIRVIKFETAVGSDLNMPGCASQRDTHWQHRNACGVFIHHRVL